METWLPWAIRHPGPVQKVGYDGGATRSLAEIEGEVKHSSEGTLAGALAELAKLDRTASWHLTIAKTGVVYQHYPLEAITWHAGLPGDRRFDTSLLGNLTLIGEEYEGGGPGNMGEPLTAKQLETSIRVSEFVRTVCPHVAASPPTLRLNLWEHGWLSPTSCPSGRIPWDRIITALEPKEEEMTPEQEALLNSLKENVDGIWRLLRELAAKHDSPQGHPVMPTVRENIDRLTAAVEELQIGTGPTLTEMANGLKIVVK